MTDSQPTVQVFTKDNCVDCEKTKSSLNDLNITYSIINMDTTPGVKEQLKAAGFRAAPVVIAGQKAWSGHKEEHILALAGQA